MSQYQEAATILQKHIEGKGGIKKLIYESNFKNKRCLLSILSETCKKYDLLRRIVNHCPEITQTLQDENLSIILTHETLFGKGIYRARKYQKIFSRLKNRLTTLSHSFGDKSAKTQPKLPRYVRINTIKISPNEACLELKNNGYKFKHDRHCPNLLVFPPDVDLHLSPLYLRGCLILQDKSSCLPPFLLKPPKNSHVIDCCAAPGNKTSYLCSLMQNTGKIFAFDIDPLRTELLSRQMALLGCTSVSVTCQDFLSLRPGDPRFSRVTHVLVDPTCTGSGMSRPSVKPDVNSREYSERLARLSSFQVGILSHALRFPSVKRVIYSTCSLNEEENEAVVDFVARKFEGQFRVRGLLRGWRHRGVGASPVARLCVRTSPGKNNTGGFFIACFVKI